MASLRGRRRLMSGDYGFDGVAYCHVNVLRLKN